MKFKRERKKKDSLACLHSCLCHNALFVINMQIYSKIYRKSKVKKFHGKVDLENRDFDRYAFKIGE